jgi:hypothetical protein
MAQGTAMAHAKYAVRAMAEERGADVFNARLAAVRAQAARP